MWYLIHSCYEYESNNGLFNKQSILLAIEISQQCSQKSFTLVHQRSQVWMYIYMTTSTQQYFQSPYLPHSKSCQEDSHPLHWVYLLRKQHPNLLFSTTLLPNRKLLLGECIEWSRGRSNEQNEPCSTRHSDRTRSECSIQGIATKIDWNKVRQVYPSSRLRYQTRQRHFWIAVECLVSQFDCFQSKKTYITRDEHHNRPA